MAWTWVHLADPSVLSARPLLDLGVGDGQTITALTSIDGLVVGLDTSSRALRAAASSGVRHRVLGDATASPIRGRSMAVVVAGDLFHHLDDAALPACLGEVRRVLASGGRLVAWWYATSGRGGPGDPAYPRDVGAVTDACRRTGLGAEEIDVRVPEGVPGTVGIVAYTARS